MVLFIMFSGCLIRSESIMVDGVERTYMIHVPRSYDGVEPVSLVVVFHGGGGNGRNIQETSDFNKKADDEGFIVVYPQGSGKFDNFLLTWNVGFCCGYAYENQIDDIRFVRVLIEDIKSRYVINDSRIYATGISNGGMMTYRIGAELEDIFAAITPIAASIGGQATEQEIIWRIPEPTEPVSAIIFHGMNDTRVPYGGGRPTANDTKGAYNYVSVNESIAFWVEHNRCSNMPSRNISASGNVICDVFTDGDNDTDVVLYTIVDGGHTWPGGRQGRKEGDIPTDEISATDLMWDFFKEHPKS